jgi:hypothetical protein
VGLPHAEHLISNSMRWHLCNVLENRLYLTLNVDLFSETFNMVFGGCIFLVS